MSVTSSKLPSLSVARTVTVTPVAVPLGVPVIAPVLLRRALQRRAEPDIDLMPSNLFTWAIAITLIALAFEFGAPAMNTPHGLTLGVVAATVMVALLLLATNSAPPAQLVAVLYMENALALFEALLPTPWPLPVHVGISAVFLLVVGVGAWLIGAPERPHGHGDKVRATA